MSCHLYSEVAVFALRIEIQLLNVPMFSLSGPTLLSESAGASMLFTDLLRRGSETALG